MRGDGGGEKGLGVEAYATILATLARPDADRERILATHGLTEEEWDAIDEEWQTKLSEATAADLGENEVIPPLVADFAQAFAKAQAAQAGGGVLSFEKYVEAARALSQPEPMAALQAVGVTFAQFVKAQQHWLQAISEDEALREKLERALNGRHQGGE
jgi:hypothetical protein